MYVSRRKETSCLRQAGIDGRQLGAEAGIMTPPARPWPRPWSLRWGWCCWEAEVLYEYTEWVTAAREQVLHLHHAYAAP